MPDNPNLRGPQDDSRINVNQPHEVRYWTAHFGITEAVLRQAVAAVGVMVTNVREWLKRNGYIR